MIALFYSNNGASRFQDNNRLHKSLFDEVKPEYCGESKNLVEKFSEVLRWCVCLKKESL